MGFTAEATDYDVLEAGVYQAVFVSVTPSAEDGLYGPYLDWEFSVLDPATLTDTKVTGRSSATFTPTSKAREWAEGLLGRQLVKRERLDFETLAQRPCQLVLEIVEKEKGTFNRIKSVLPAPPTASPNAVQPAVGPDMTEFLAWKKEKQADPERRRPATTVAPVGDELVEA